MNLSLPQWQDSHRDHGRHQRRLGRRWRARRRHQLTLAVGLQDHHKKLDAADQAYADLLVSADETGSPLELASGLRLKLPAKGTFEDRQLEWTLGEEEAGKFLWVRIRGVSITGVRGNDGLTVDHMRLSVMRAAQGDKDAGL